MKIYDIEELVPMLRLSKKAIRSYVAEGKLKGKKIGKHWLVTEDSLRAFLMEGENMLSSSLKVHDQAVSQTPEGAEIS